MRKVLLMLVFCCTICGNAQEYTKFMGISLSNTPSTFEKKLIEKGFKKDNHYYYTGNIDGANDYCNVRLNVEEGKIESVSVYRFSEKNDTLSAIRILANRYNVLTKRHGECCDVQEYEDVPNDFSFERFTFFFYKKRIFLYSTTMEEGDVSGMKRGDKVYVITETYLPLP